MHFPFCNLNTISGVAFSLQKPNYGVFRANVLYLSLDDLFALYFSDHMYHIQRSHVIQYVNFNGVKYRKRFNL